MKRIRISPYHPQSNAIVEVGHKPILDACSKLSNGGLGKIREHIPAVLWAERTTAVSSTGLTPAEVMIGRDAVLPIELEHKTFRVMDWEKVRTRAELLALRAQALQDMSVRVEEGKLRQERLRAQQKEYFDDRRRPDNRILEKGDLVLVYRSELKTNYSHKLAFRWEGPFRI